MRLAEWPRDPYLNEEVREWVQLHLETLGVTDVAVYATVVGRDEDERRVVVATEVGLVDSWYAPQGSSARFGLSMRLYPWQAVHGVDLRGETTRVWAYEHASRWRLRIARPALDLLAETPELGRALAQFAAACAVMAEPAGSAEGSPAPEVAIAREAAPPADVRQVPAPPPRSELPPPEPPREDPVTNHEAEQPSMPTPLVAAAPPAAPPIEPQPSGAELQSAELPAPQVVEQPSEPAMAVEQVQAYVPPEPVEEPAAPIEQPQEQHAESQPVARREPMDAGDGLPAEAANAEPMPAGTTAGSSEAPGQSFTSIESPPGVVQAASEPAEPQAARETVAELEAEPAPIEQQPTALHADRPESVQPEPARAESPPVEPAASAPPAAPAMPTPAMPRPTVPPEPVASAPEPAVNYEEQYPGEEVLFGINPLPAEPPPSVPPLQRAPGSILRPERNGDAHASGNGTPVPPAAQDVAERHGPFPRQSAQPAEGASLDDGASQAPEQRRAPFPGQIFRIGARQQSAGAARPREASERTPLKVEAESTAEVIQDLERRLGLRPRR